MTAELPTGPLMPVVGPVAVSVQAVGTAVPPLSLVTVLTRVRWGCWAVLVMVQVALEPTPRVTLVAVVDAAPVQVQVDAE